MSNEDEGVGAQQERSITHHSVRVGFCGTGLIARAHLRGLLALEDVEIVGLYDAAPGKAAETLALARSWAEPDSPRPAPRRLEARLYDRPAALLDDVDALYVCLPPPFHGDIEVAAAAAGVALFVEKPVALDMATAGRVAEAIARAGIIATGGYQLRYGAGPRAGRSALAATTPALAVGQYLTSLPSTPWWRVLAQSGGQLVEQATHTVDLMRYLVGEIEAVWASGSPVAVPGTTMDVPGATALAARFAGGAVGTLAATCLLNDDARTTVGTNDLRVVAPSLVVEVQGVSARVVRPAGTEAYEDTMAATMLALDATFTRAVASGDAGGLHSTYLDATRTLAVTLAASESMRTGQVARPAYL